jgi:phage terminase large subunit-like protein
LALTAEGALPFPELVFSALKKSGKTTLAAVIVLYVVRVLGGRFAEGYCVANDFDQAAGRVFQAAVRIIDASPLLRGTARATADTITFAETGATITALPSDYAGAAGVNPVCVVFDELWAFTSERSRRLWDELVPVPTRAVSVRLTVTYAGFEGESGLLEELYRRGLRGEEIAPALYRGEGLLMFWSHEPVAPWQTPEWLAQMRAQLRPSAYVRMIENRFVSGESSFVPLEWWDTCVQPELRSVITDRSLPVWVGVDASVRRDSTAIVAVTWDATAKRVRLVWHRIFQPSPDDPINFELEIEETLLRLAERFDVQKIRFDPYQLVATAQRLQKQGLPMEEYPQTLDRLTAMGSNLYDLLKAGNLETYPDAELRRAVASAVARETPRGWRIAKERASHKIDVVVALAMASLAAVEEQTSAGSWLVSIGGVVMDLRGGPHGGDDF